MLRALKAGQTDSAVVSTTSITSGACLKMFACMYLALDMVITVG